VKGFSILCHPMSQKSLPYGRFPGFARLSFWQQQHADEDQHQALVE
jgi:hypothetical protein